MHKHLGFEIKTLSRMMKQYIDNSEFMKNNANMTGMQGWVLGYLDNHSEEEVFQKDVESQFRIRRSTATELLKVMEKGGLIQRVPIERDARLKKIIMTPLAKELTRKSMETIDEAESTLTKGFTEEEVELMFSFLNRCKANLSRED